MFNSELMSPVDLFMPPQSADHFHKATGLTPFPTFQSIPSLCHLYQLIDSPSRAQVVRNRNHSQTLLFAVNQYNETPLTSVESIST